MSAAAERVDPFGRLPTAHRLVLAAALLPVVVFLGLQAEAGLCSLHAAPIRQLALHAGTGQGEQALSQWQVRGLVPRVVEGIAWDMAFAPAYAAALALIVSSLARALWRRARPVGTVALVASWMVILAAGLDWLENAGMVKLLEGDARWNDIVRVAAWSKFTLIAVATAAILSGTGALLLSRRAHRDQEAARLVAGVTP